LDLAELHLFVDERRAQALSTRETANHLVDHAERRKILRFAEDLDRDAAKLDAEIAAKKSARYAIDVI
jgi:hypothetical protein